MTTPMILLVLGIIIYSWVLRRQRNQRNGRMTSFQEMRADLQALQSTPEGLLHKLEVQLYDYDREVEGRIGTRLEMLNQLILEADREIHKLQVLLAESHRKTPEISDAELLQRAFALYEAGFTETEISLCLQVPEFRVQQALRQWQDQNDLAA